MILSILQFFALSVPATPVATDLPTPAPVTATASTSSQALAAAPTILFALPSSGSQLDPVVIVGTNFADGALPFFGFIPSIPLYTFSTGRIPFLGRVSVMVTAVPFTFFPGTVDLTVLSDFQSSNAIDFTITS